MRYKGFFQDGTEQDLGTPVETTLSLDEEAPADLCRRVDLDAREESRYLRQHARQAAELVVPQPVLGCVHPFGVQARVGQEDDQAVLRGGVVALDRRDVLFDGCDEAHGRLPSIGECDQYSESIANR